METSRGTATICQEYLSCLLLLPENGNPSGYCDTFSQDVKTPVITS